MPTWYNYTIILPLKEEYKDDGSNDLFRIPITVNGVGTFEASAIASHGRIEMLRVATLNSDGNLTSEQEKAVRTIKAQLIAVLRITHDLDIREYRRGSVFLSLGTKDVDGNPSLSIRIEERGALNLGNANNIKNTFLATINIKPLIILIGDVQDAALPLQYRYPSLYKAFELEFRVAGKWADLKSVFASINARYEALGLKRRSLVALFHQLRDSCAHIRTGSTDKLGLVGLPDPDAHAVELILPMLIDLLLEHMNNKYPSLKVARGGAI
jgi:hypothetical protein